MEKSRFQNAASSAFTGFFPGVVVFMVLMLAAVSSLYSGNGNDSSRTMSLTVLILEIGFLTIGYTIIAASLSQRISHVNRIRGVIAGLVSVIFLGLLSIFTEGANWSMIIIFSIMAGMFAALVVLIPERTQHNIKAVS